MKKARFILTALILLAGVGGALAFNASRFTANPVQLPTDELHTTFNGMDCTAFAGIGGNPVFLCIRDNIAYWTPFGGATLNAFSTLAATTSIVYFCPDGTRTIRIVHVCAPTTGLATFNI